MTAPGCFILASGFTSNVGIATNVGSDTAVFSDSAGSDTFYSYDDYNNSGEPAAGMYGNYGGGYANSAIGFGTCYASSQFGGSDTAYLYDSLGNATFDAYGPLNAQAPTLAIMYAKYETIVSGFATNAAYTTDGSDTANFYDTVGVMDGLENAAGLGNATYYADADYNNSGQPAAGMYGSYDGGYSNSAIGFGTNVGYSIIGGDTAYFYDSPGNDTYYSYANLNGQTSAGMYGSYGGGYNNSAIGFATNVGCSTNGGSDTAYFYDSPGTDTYYAYADYNGSGSGKPFSGMYGSYGGGYSNSAVGFATNIGYSTNGGGDTAYFYDSPGNDTYYADADYNGSDSPAAGMYGGVPGTPGPGGGYFNSAVGFGTNIAYSTAGGSDTAYFYDSPGNDTFYAYADYNNSGQTAAGMYGGYGVGYSNLAYGFATNVGNSTAGGSDTAYFYGSPQSDTFYAYANYDNSGQSSGGMYGGVPGTPGLGGGYSNVANGFATNLGYATSGSSDTAYLYGSSGNNALYTDLAIAELYGSNGFSSAGYGEQASGFAVVDASAPASGNNTRTQGPDSLDYQLNLSGTWVGGS